MAVRFLRNAYRARPVAQSTLEQILALNGDTEWGRARGLNSPAAVKAFQALPTTTYQDYLPFIERVANGEPNILTHDPVTYFAVTSGTTGPQKLVPVTRRQTRIILANMFVPLGLTRRSGLLGPMRGRMFQIMTEHITGLTPGGIPKGAATSGGLRSMGKLLEYIFTSPMAVIQIQDQPASRYLHLLFALGEEHLWTIASIFPSTLLYALRDLHRHAESLLRDLHDGAIARTVDISDDARGALTERLRPNPSRARRLSALWEKDRFTVHDIWPSVGAVVTTGSGTFRFYVEQLRPFLGGVPVFSPVYAASEAVIGIGVSPDRPGYVLSTGAAYQEFLPLEKADDPNARPLALDQVEIGQDYEIVLTTFAGLTRYRLGDVVRVLGFYGEAPVIEFVERRGQVINVVGEKTGEAQLARAFEEACRETNVPVVDYVVTIDARSTPTRYVLLLEGFPTTGPAAASEVDSAIPQLLRSFERRLRSLARNYHDARTMGQLAPMAAYLLAPGSFERFYERRVQAGTSATQVKVPHVIPDPARANDWFLQEPPLAVVV